MIQPPDPATGSRHLYYYANGSGLRHSLLGFAGQAGEFVIPITDFTLRGDALQPVGEFCIGHRCYG